MTPNRRRFLSIAGGGVILAAGGAGAFLGTRRPSRALAPWGKAGDYIEPRRRALSYAILAPNPHNRQPWVVELKGDKQITVWRDKSRNLPETDPFDRQLTIGMGCFLETLAIAAGETGHKAQMDLFPSGDTGPVAVVRFDDGGARDPLFAQIPHRRSCKEPFEDKLVAPDLAARLSDLADTHTAQAKVDAIRKLTLGAWTVEAQTPRTIKESVDLFRMGKAEINASPDGIYLGGPMLETLMLAGMLTRDGQLDPTSAEFAQTTEMYREMLASTPAYASIATPGDSRLDQIDAGRRWMRLNLTTTALGLSLHPVSQALQEYPEMAQHYRTAHALLTTPGNTVQMLGRLGYGPKTPETPRWPLETRIRNG